MRFWKWWMLSFSFCDSYSICHLSWELWQWHGCLSIWESGLAGPRAFALLWLSLSPHWIGGLRPFLSKGPKYWHWHRAPLSDFYSNTFWRCYTGIDHITYVLQPASIHQPHITMSSCTLEHGAHCSNEEAGIRGLDDTVSFLALWFVWVRPRSWWGDRE